MSLKATASPVRGDRLYAEEARSRFRHGTGGVGDWQAVYEEGITQAIEDRDPLGLAQFAVAAAVRWDAEGLHHMALEKLRIAEEKGRRLPQASALLNAWLAIFEALAGHPELARQLSTRANQGPLTDATSLDIEVTSLTVRLLAFDHTVGDGVVDGIVTSQQQGRDWGSSSLMSWYVPAVLAMGQPARAQAWTEELRVSARAAGHPWREVDAATFAYANSLAVRKPIEPPTEAELAGSQNVNARWRLHCLGFREAILRKDWIRAREEIARLGVIAPSVGPGFVDGSWLYAAFIAAMRGDEDEASPPVPDHLSLLNLGAVLAGIEAVAVAGRQSAAVEWLRWVDENLPKKVETALEWPVSAARVRGLLMARAGDIPGALLALREGVRWAKEAGYVVEQALGEVQLAEMLAHGGRTARRSSWDRLRRDGTAVLEELGLEPILPAYLVTRLLALSRSEDHTPLTPREVEVLSGLSRGSTYKEIGLALNISWRTVRVHVTHVYEKLDVSRKIDAVRVGGELGII